VALRPLQRIVGPGATQRNPSNQADTPMCRVHLGSMARPASEIGILDTLLGIHQDVRPHRGGTSLNRDSAAE
jgi:hypothetical protein